MPDPSLRPSEGPSVWYGPDMAQRPGWVHKLTATHIAELEAATDPFIESDDDLAGLDLAALSLPSLAPFMHNIACEVVEGRGFVLVRGLPVERWSRRRGALAADRDHGIRLPCSLDMFTITNVRRLAPSKASATLARDIDMRGTAP